MTETFSLIIVKGNGIKNILGLSKGTWYVKTSPVDTNYFKGTSCFHALIYFQIAYEDVATD